MDHTLFKVNALQAAGIEYVPVPRDHIDRLEMEMMLGFMQKDMILNSIDTNFQVAGAEEFWKLIDSLINQNVELHAEHVAAAKAKDLQNYNFLYDIAPDLNKIIQDAIPDIESFTKQFYDAGKAQGFSDLDVKAFTGVSDTNALFHLTNYNYDLIRNVNEDIVRGVRQRVWQGVARGRSNKEIERQIKKLPLEPISAGNRMLSPAERSKLIAHTESTRGRHQGIYMSYKQYNVSHYDLVNTPWKRLCNKCRARAKDNPYKIDDLTGWPPIHVLCHCGVNATSDPSETPEDPNEYLNFVTKEIEPVNKDLILNTSDFKTSKSVGSSKAENAADKYLKNNFDEKNEIFCVTNSKGKIIKEIKGNGREIPGTNAYKLRGYKGDGGVVAAHTHPPEPLTSKKVTIPTFSHDDVANQIKSQFPQLRVLDEFGYVHVMEITPDAVIKYGRMSGSELESLENDIFTKFSTKLNNWNKDIKEQIPKDLNEDQFYMEYKDRIGKDSWKIWDELASELGLKYKRLDKYVK